MEISDEDIIRFFKRGPLANKLVMRVQTVLEPTEGFSRPLIQTRVNTFEVSDREDMVAFLFDMSFTHYIRSVERIPHALSEYTYGTPNRRTYDFVLVESKTHETNITSSLIDCLVHSMREPEDGK